MNSAADRVTAGGVALTGLCVRRGDVEAVRDVTGVFAAGSLTAVIGPNGAGKSSLLEAIAGRLSPSGGTLECTVPASDIAYLAQVSHLDLRVPVTVFDFVAAGAWRRTGIFAGVDDVSKSCVNNQEYDGMIDPGDIVLGLSICR